MFGEWSVSLVIGRTLCGHVGGGCGAACEREYGTETTDDTVWFAGPPTADDVAALVPSGWVLLEAVPARVRDLAGV